MKASRPMSAAELEPMMKLQDVRLKEMTKKLSWLEVAEKMRVEDIYVQGRKGNDAVVHCLSRADGKSQWVAPIGPYRDQDRGGGSRGTPTLDGDKLYVLTENGDLACLNAKDGSKVWGKNILKEYNGSNPHWLISESPLVDGEFLIVTPGGQGAGMVKLEKATGKTVWA